MDNGFITLHRKIMEWEWYTDSNTFRLFVHLLLKANHEPKKWRGIQVDRGQCITGRKVLAEELCLSEQQIRTSLKKLKSTGEITTKPTNKFSLVTLVNYSVYQEKKKRRQPTNKPATQPTNNQQVTTNNNDNNDNNKKSSRFAPPSVDEVREYCKEKGYSVDPVQFVDFYVSKGWMVGKNKMKDWKAATRTWQQRMIQKGLVQNKANTQSVYVDDSGVPDIVE